MMKTLSFKLIVIVCLISSSQYVRAQFATSVDYTPAQLNSLWTDFMRSKENNVNTYFPHGRCFKDAAKKHDIPESLLLAVARGESNFDGNAVSKANAIGLMQIQWPQTAKHLGIVNKEQLFEPCININAGASYLKELFTRYNRNVYLVLAAYNYGPSRIKPDSIVEKIPEGAHWYSEYIFDHLQYVLSTRVSNYSSSNQALLITFNRPYRAKEFIKYLQSKAPNLRFDWFKKKFDKFDVVFHYETAEQKLIGIKLLKPLGFNIN